MGHMYHSRFSDTQDVGVPQIKVKENDSEGDYHRAFCSVRAVYLGIIRNNTI